MGIPGEHLALTSSQDPAISTKAAPQDITNRFDEVQTSLKRKISRDTDSGEDSDRSSANGKRTKYTIPTSTKETSWARIKNKPYIEHQRKRIKKLEHANGVTQSDQLKGIIEQSPYRRKKFRDAMEKLSNEKATSEQRDLISKAACSAPYYLARTASLITGDRLDRRPSSGHTAADLVMPAAVTHRGHSVHPSINDIPQGEQIYMIGHRLLWTYIREDEYLSHTNSMLFGLVHSLDRRHTGQGGITMQFFDRRRTKTVDGKSKAAFYPALDLYETFRVPESPHWTRPQQYALRSRKFTHEFLSHGVVLLDDSVFKQAKIEDLISDGLFDIVPELDVPDEYRRAGLYGGQVAFRKMAFPARKGDLDARGRQLMYSYERCATAFAFTAELLSTVERVCQKNFMNGPLEGAADGDVEAMVPHLHILVSFLGLRKRPAKDPLFLDYIKAYYNGEYVLRNCHMVRANKDSCRCARSLYRRQWRHASSVYSRCQ